MINRLFAALLISVACSTAAFADDLVKKFDTTIALTEASRAAHCPVQTVAKIRKACDRAYDMIVAREKSDQAQLAFMLSVKELSDHPKLKDELVVLRPFESYNVEVRETSMWILVVENEFKADRQVAGR